MNSPSYFRLAYLLVILLAPSAPCTLCSPIAAAQSHEGRLSRPSWQPTRPPRRRSGSPPVRWQPTPRPTPRPQTPSIGRPPSISRPAVRQDFQSPVVRPVRNTLPQSNTSLQLLSNILPSTPLTNALPEIITKPVDVVKNHVSRAFTKRKPKVTEIPDNETIEKNARRSALKRKGYSDMQVDVIEQIREGTLSPENQRLLDELTEEEHNRIAAELKEETGLDPAQYDELVDRLAYEEAQKRFEHIFGLDMSGSEQMAEAMKDAERRQQEDFDQTYGAIEAPERPLGVRQNGSPGPPYGKMLDYKSTRGKRTWWNPLDDMKEAEVYYRDVALRASQERQPYKSPFDALDPRKRDTSAAEISRMNGDTAPASMSQRLKELYAKDVADAEPSSTSNSENKSQTFTFSDWLSAHHFDLTTDTSNLITKEKSTPSPGNNWSGTPKYTAPMAGRRRRIAAGSQSGSSMSFKLSADRQAPTYKPISDISEDDDPDQDYYHNWKESSSAPGEQSDSSYDRDRATGESLFGDEADDDDDFNTSHSSPNRLRQKDRERNALDGLSADEFVENAAASYFDSRTPGLPVYNRDGDTDTSATPSDSAPTIQTNSPEPSTWPLSPRRSRGRSQDRSTSSAKEKPRNRSGFEPQTGQATNNRGQKQSQFTPHAAGGVTKSASESQRFNQNDQQGRRVPHSTEYPKNQIPGTGPTQEGNTQSDPPRRNMIPEQHGNRSPSSRDFEREANRLERELAQKYPHGRPTELGILAVYMPGDVTTAGVTKVAETIKAVTRDHGPVAGISMALASTAAVPFIVYGGALVDMSITGAQLMMGNSEHGDAADHDRMVERIKQMRRSQRQ